MAPVLKRLTMLEAGSTSPSGIAFVSSNRNPSRPRSVCGSNSSSTMAEYLRKHAKSPVRTAFCSVRMVIGLYI